MSSMTHILAPEAEELQDRRRQLTDLEQELTEKELLLSTVKGELHLFERRYHQILAGKFAELDNVKALVLEVASKMYPRADGFRDGAEFARKQAQHSAEEAEEAQNESGEEEEFVPSEDLKKLFRDVAKKIHPDLAPDEKERARRHDLMLRLNQAYDRLDADGIRAVLIEWEANDHTTRELSVGAQLVRTIRQITQVRIRLNHISSELEFLENSEMFQLKRNAECAQIDGRDLLQEMAEDIEEEIIAIKSQVKQLADGLF